MTDDERVLVDCPVCGTVGPSHVRISGVSISGFDAGCDSCGWDSGGDVDVTVEIACAHCNVTVYKKEFLGVPG